MDSVPAIIGVTLTGVAMLGGLLLYVIRGEIHKATRPIQPDANGGSSLPDVARGVQANADALDKLDRSNSAFHELLAARVHDIHRRIDELHPEPHNRRRED